ncbi:MAG: hypothetical protein ACM30G_15060 [Micromonosporaceae bacterium]
MSGFRNATNVVEPFLLPDLSDEEVRAYVSRLWAQDWDCPEDGAYDALAASRDQEDEDFDAAMRRRVRDATDDLEDE